MPPILANVSFGIFALMPLGWLFMAAIIAIESIILSQILTRRWWSAKAASSATIANITSGLVGFGTSLWMNGGWWLVVWLPWVSSNEVNWALSASRRGLTIYYVAAFLLSLAIEGLVEQFLLRKLAQRALVWKACLRANILSYLLGSIVMYSWSFGLWS